MVIRPRLIEKAKDIEDDILCLLHYRSAHSDKAVLLSNGEIKNNIGNCASHLFDMAIKSAAFRNNIGCEWADTWEGPATMVYSITRQGMEYVEDWEDEKYQRIAESIKLTESNAPIPAADRTVTLNHNQPDYQEAVAALDKAILAFRDDHRLDNELGHEKGALLKALEGGRELLNDTAVHVRVGTALILEPLRRLGEKYENQIVGALANAAVRLVMTLFGL